MNFYTYVGNNPVNWVDPWGWRPENKGKSWWEKWSIGSSYGLGGLSSGWDTGDPAKSGLDYTLGEAWGAGWHVNWTSDSNYLDNSELSVEPIIWNIGLGEYLGVSFADDFSSFSINIGLGGAISPITPTLRLDDNIYE